MRRKPALNGATLSAILRGTALLLAISFAAASPSRADVILTFSNAGTGDGYADLVGCTLGDTCTLTGATGIFEGLTIAGLGDFDSPDNILHEPGDETDSSGISFALGGGDQVNLNGGNPAIAVLYLSEDGGIIVGGGAQTLATAAPAVPEPTSCSLIIAGLGGLGLIRRRRTMRRTA
jgi:PEP-CTERM motif